MKTLRRFVAVALLLGAYSVGFAQDNSVPNFKSDAEKQAWIEANPNQYEALQQTDRVVEKQDANVRSVERFSSEEEKRAYLNDNSLPNFSSDEEKQAWINANPDKYEALKSTKRADKPATQRFVNSERFGSVEEKETWLEQNKQ